MAVFEISLPRARSSAVMKTAHCSSDGRTRFGSESPSNYGGRPTVGDSHSLRQTHAASTSPSSRWTREPRLGAQSMSCHSSREVFCPVHAAVAAAFPSCGVGWAQRYVSDLDMIATTAGELGRARARTGRRLLYGCPGVERTRQAAMCALGGLRNVSRMHNVGALARVLEPGAEEGLHARRLARPDHSCEDPQRGLLRCGLLVPVQAQGRWSGVLDRVHDRVYISNAALCKCFSGGLTTSMTVS